MQVEGWQIHSTKWEEKGICKFLGLKGRYQQRHLEVFADLATNQKAGSTNLSGRVTSPGMRQLQLKWTSGVFPFPSVP